ncbi:MAG: hypothetical protein V1820_00940 [archaeon]
MKMTPKYAPKARTQPASGTAAAVQEPVWQADPGLDVPAGPPDYKEPEKYRAGFGSRALAAVEEGAARLVLSMGGNQNMILAPIGQMIGGEEGDRFVRSGNKATGALVGGIAKVAGGIPFGIGPAVARIGEGAYDLSKKLRADARSRRADDYNPEGLSLEDKLYRKIGGWLSPHLADRVVTGLEHPHAQKKAAELGNLIGQGPDAVTGAFYASMENKVDEKFGPGAYEWVSGFVGDAAAKVRSYKPSAADAASYVQ